MKVSQKLKFGVAIFVIGISFWQFGLFNRFNYFTAKIDIIRGQPKIVEVGVPLYFGVAYNSLNEEYGFYGSNVGCFITRPKLRGINAYNSQVEKHLILRNGENWRKEYQEKIDLIINQGLVE